MAELPSRIVAGLKRVVNEQLARRGFQLVAVTPKARPRRGTRRRAASDDAGAPHAPVRPQATYSPWLADEGFLANEQEIGTSTLVDRFRRYELWQLVAESAKLPAGDLLEVGVWRGGTGALIAQRARQCGLDDTVYLCDTFSGVVKAGERDSWYSGGEHADADAASVRALMERLGLEGVEVLEGVFPEDAGDRLEGRSFRFCHLDVDVYESTRAAFDWVWERMVPGGIVVFDDYGFATCDGVRRFVDEVRPAAGRVVVHNLNGHAVIVKTEA